MHPQVLRGRRAWGLAAALCCGCASPETLGSERAAIAGGVETGDSHPSVLYVMAEVREFQGNPVVKVGSGTLLAPNLVLTALHVVSQNPSNVPFTCDATGNDVSGSEGSLLGPPVAPEKVSIFEGPTPADEVARGAQIVSTGSDTICENDLAFIVLDQPLSLPLVRIRKEQAAELGDPLTVIGYGAEGLDPSLGVSRTQRDVQVTALGQWIRTFTVSEGPCEGDSGGPALSADGEIVGVFSTVGVQCTGPKASAKYTDLSYFTPLIEQAFDAAGAGSPWSSAGTAAGGAAGEPSVAEPTSGAPSEPKPTPRGSDSSCALGPLAAPRATPFSLVSLASALLVRRVGQRRRRGAVTARLA